MKIKRTHDKLYLKENRKKNPKEYFKFILRHAKTHISKYDFPRIIDIGCATGDFLWYIHQNHPKAELVGVDVKSELLNKAKKEVKNASFVKGNIYTGENLPQGNFNAVFMSGVHSIFDDIKPWLNNLLNLINDNGKIYIFGIFNPEDVDVLVKAKKSDEKIWQPGWNLFSKKTMSKYLEVKNIEYSFEKFNIKIDIEKNDKDPLRSWTFKLENGQRRIVNGVQLIHHFYLLELSFKK